MKTFALKPLAHALLVAGLAVATPVLAQHQGHTMPEPAAPAKKPAAKKPAAKPATPPPDRRAAPRTSAPAAAEPQAVDHAAMGHAPAAAPSAKPTASAPVDHTAMGHGPAPSKTPAAKPAPAKPPTEVDHAAMGHGASAAGASKDAPTPKDDAAMQGMDHSAMGHEPPSEPGEEMDHSTMDHAAMGRGAPDPDLPADAAPREPIPAITDAVRVAAFPPLDGHATHDQRNHWFWLIDRLEWQDSEEGGAGWETLAWYGGDINRVWLRSEGESDGGQVEEGNIEVLYGRSVSTWWDVVAGVRQDFGEGPSRTYAAFGVQGLAPYKFEVEATAYVGASGRTAAVVEAEYDTLITNRLILQWQGGISLYGKDDPAAGIGSGLSTVEAGARLRYEFTRRFAPYIGVQWERAFGETADLRREDGEDIRDTRIVAGVRIWF